MCALSRTAANDNHRSRQRIIIDRETDPIMIINYSRAVFPVHA